MALSIPLDTDVPNILTTPWLCFAVDLYKEQIGRLPSAHNNTNLLPYTRYSEQGNGYGGITNLNISGHVTTVPRTHTGNGKRHLTFSCNERKQGRKNAANFKILFQMASFAAAHKKQTHHINSCKSDAIIYTGYYHFIFIMSIYPEIIKYSFILSLQQITYKGWKSCETFTLSVVFLRFNE